MMLGTNKVTVIHFQASVKQERRRATFYHDSTVLGMQVSFALGAVKTGIPGGLLGGALFQLPGLIIMSLVGVGAASFLKDSHPLAKATTDGVHLAYMAVKSLVFPLGALLWF